MSTVASSDSRAGRPVAARHVLFLAAWRRMIGTLAMLAAMSATLPAQAFNSSLGPVEHSRIVSLNPLLLVFSGTISADYEQRTSGSTSLGGSISSFSWSDADYLTVESRARYYVSGRALDGFAVGAVLGLVRLSADDSSRARTYAMNVGFTAEQQWLLGIDERVALTAGAGATRLFFGEDRKPFRRVLPVLRLSVGWGF